MMSKIGKTDEYKVGYKVALVRLKRLMSTKWAKKQHYNFNEYIKL